jgi:hypothetical protein
MKLPAGILKTPKTLPGGAVILFPQAFADLCLAASRYEYRMMSPGAMSDLNPLQR